MHYKNVILGGTFDHLHRGHEALILKAFEIGETVWLGLTADEFVKESLLKTDQFAYLIEPFDERLIVVKGYLEKNDWMDLVKIIPLTNRLGTTLSDATLEAIVVSPETEVIAREINVLRKQKNWSELEVILVPWVLAADGNPIHSKRIRAGLIDRTGVVFSIPENWGVRQLPEAVRQELKKPLGTLVKDVSHNQEKTAQELIEKYVQTKKSLLISVGDAITLAFMQNKVVPDISIIDFYIQRTQVYQNIVDYGFAKDAHVTQVANLPGTLSFEAFAKVQQMIVGPYPQLLVVEGEEDLLSLFAILAAPLYSLVCYGQPNEGVVVVEVTEEKKREALSYIIAMS